MNIQSLILFYGIIKVMLISEAKHMKEHLLQYMSDIKLILLIRLNSMLIHTRNTIKSIETNKWISSFLFVFSIILYNI